MYLRHFGLREKPFALTPNTDFFVPLPVHMQALEVLCTALSEGEGFIKVVGEVGTGKTLLCRMLLAELEDPWVTVHLSNSFLSPSGVYAALARELQVVEDEDLPSHQLIERIQNRVLELRVEGRRPVLIIDEAQSLPTASLEAIRLLTNLETERSKLLQVVLVGQPELDERLRNRALRQLGQRVSFSARLAPLSRAETRRYLHHRLSAAGRSADLPFTASAIRKLHRASGGIPRVLNLLSHKAMMSAYGRGDARIRWSHMRRAVVDTPATSGHGWRMLG
ncbi:MAG: AAA family ATPase [Myxococcales bacterium]|nr:AAA family ATPase [Myxococcales bacterium]